MSKKTILLIEDDTTDARLTLKAFKKSNINFNFVLMAYNGKQAMDYLLFKGEFKNQEISFIPDLILLDLKLPQYSGFEVLKQIRASEHTKMVPVVVFTSSNNREDIIKSYQLGANSFVQKPINFEEFIESVKLTLKFWLLVNKV